MEAKTLKDHLTEQITFARDSFLKDMDALDEPELNKSIGGVARAPYDFIYEVTFVNRRIATRLAGGVPETFDGEGWMKAPEEFRAKSVAAGEFKKSMDSVLDAWAAFPAEDIVKKIEIPGGETSGLKLASLCATHAVYHDAQLNFIQCLTGDDEMHWD